MKNNLIRRTQFTGGASAGLSVLGRFALTIGILTSLLCGVTSVEVEAQERESRADRVAPNTAIEEELRLMREEIHALREEVDGLRQELRGNGNVTGRGSTVYPRTPAMTISKREPTAGNLDAVVNDRRHSEPSNVSGQVTSSAGQHYAQPSTPSSAQPQASDQQSSNVADTVSMLQSQIAEQAQTKVESSSKMPVKLFGTILSTTFFNSGPADWADVPSTVNWAKVVPSSTGSFSSSLRQSRVGLLIDGPTFGSVHANGYFAVDFLGGAADFQSGPLFGLPHVVYGYMRFEGARTALEAGQDEMILAPRHPTSLVAMSFPELFRSGSLYVRAPQVRVERELGNSKLGSLRFALGLVAPVGNYPGLDFPDAGLAEAWQRPALQGRLAWRSATAPADAKSGFEFGLSAHYGTVRLGIPSAKSWAAAFDFDAHRGRWGADGEAYLGQNLQSFGGGIGQPGRTLGGYAEARLTAIQRLQFNTGFGSDHLTKFDIVPVPINRNTSVFANTIFQFTPEVAASFEYRHLVTRPFTGVLRRNEHLDVGIAYSF